MLALFGITAICGLGVSDFCSALLVAGVEESAADFSSREIEKSTENQIITDKKICNFVSILLTAWFSLRSTSPPHIPSITGGAVMFPFEAKPGSCRKM